MPRQSVAHRFQRLACAAALLAAAGAGPVRAQGLEPLALDAHAGSGQPRLARTPGGTAVLSWLEPGAREGHTRLRVATRADGAVGWSPPRTVVEGTGWFVNWADVPGVVPVTESLWAAHWLERSEASSPYAYDVRVAVSRDAGRTWAPPVTPHTDGTATEHGFVSVFQWPGHDAVGLVWLDGRATAGGGHHAGHGAMTLRTARLGDDGSLHDEAVLDTRVCECCPTAAVNTAEGIVVAYRNRGDDETRDIHIVRHAQGWQADHVAVADGWTIAACPVNGPALHAEGADVAMAWFTAADDRPRVQVTVSRDTGRTWSAPVSVDDGHPLGRVAIAGHPDGGVVVAWVEAEATGATVRVRRLPRDAARGPAVVVARVEQSRRSGYPRLVRAGDDLLLAWVQTDAGTTRVQTARLSVNAVR